MAPLLLLWVCAAAELILTVLGTLEPPINAKIHALNFKYLLKWEYGQRSNEGNCSVTFTVQSRSKTVNMWSNVPNCENICLAECDWTPLNIYFFVTYFLRVQAHQGNQTSPWLNTKAFATYKHIQIGPPGVKLKSKHSSLIVNITAPQTTNESFFRFNCNEYKISYWKFMQQENKKSIISTSSLVSIPNLKLWTVYCLEVQGFCPLLNITYHSSSVTCEKIVGLIPLWVTFITFIISLVVVFVVVTGTFLCVYWTYRGVKHIFFPSYNLPEHIQEYFSELAQNVPILVPGSEEGAEECCDYFKVVLATESLGSYSGFSVLNIDDSGTLSRDTTADSGCFFNEGESCRSTSTRASEGKT
eukprot:gi/632975334/ref/XP_007904171.1/ PREDICTED: interferon alpha/beta receptor 1-like [Callorhinchus milii]